MAKMNTRGAPEQATENGPRRQARHSETAEHRGLLRREDVVLVAWAALIGLAAAAVFGAYRAVSVDGEDAAGRLAEFAQNLLWPGVLILAGVAVAVCVGWKANLD